MKKNYLLLSMVLIPLTTLFSQSTIYKNDKTEIKADVVEIQEVYIKYRLFNDPNKTLRNIKISDVFMIVYEDGTVEKFNREESKTIENDVINNKETETSEPDKQILENSQSLNASKEVGFTFGGKAGFYIPYNQDIKEIYGSGFMFGLVIGYWGPKSGFEMNWRFYSKKGDPYTYGQVTSAESKLSISPLTFSGYWRFPSEGKLETYLGGGLGICSIKESVSMLSNGQSASDSGEWTGFELHSTGGIKYAPFYLEITFSSVSVSNIDANLGGIIISGGLFF